MGRKIDFDTRETAELAAGLRGMTHENRENLFTEATMVDEFISHLTKLEPPVYHKLRTEVTNLSLEKGLGYATLAQVQEKQLRDKRKVERKLARDPPPDDEIVDRPFEKVLECIEYYTKQYDIESYYRTLNHSKERNKAKFAFDKDAFTGEVEELLKLRPDVTMSKYTHRFEKGVHEALLDVIWKAYEQLPLDRRYNPIEKRPDDDNDEQFIDVEDAEAVDPQDEIFRDLTGLERAKAEYDQRIGKVNQERLILEQEKAQFEEQVARSQAEINAERIEKESLKSQNRKFNIKLQQLEQLADTSRAEKETAEAAQVALVARLEELSNKQANTPELKAMQSQLNKSIKEMSDLQSKLQNANLQLKQADKTADIKAQKAAEALLLQH
ncbi:hypothetical protein B0J14DRAFT_652282 [Halenospora varia]|nr:hypothetical protein B0J14DRAFT_652282 [Halenospora varia]